MRRICCECCGGTGFRELTQTEQITALAVSSTWSSTFDILERLNRVQTTGKLSMPALCNRLVRLVDLGIVERRRVTRREYEWRLNPL